mmetsp:Transcript_21562/g.45348  ORF Transcript_21562/g.45348 Transcript_21562/m.45348 type:complete len:525 (-) Transcript_21562:147-1721(-)
MNPSKRKRTASDSGNKSETKSKSNKNDNSNQSNNNRRRNNKHSNSHNGPNQQHRFGRVMSHPPKLKLNTAPAPAPTTSSANTPTRKYPTVSIAIPGSVVSNAQTRELQTQLAGQIARAAAVFRIDEVVVFDDGLGTKLKTVSNFHRGPRRDHHPNNNINTNNSNDEKKEEDEDDNNAKQQKEKQLHIEQKNPQQAPSTDPHAFLARILQFCECPQYLRRKFFPMHPDLQFAGLLPPLDMPHHLRRGDVVPFREGVVVESNASAGANGDGEEGGSGGGSLVECGVPNRLVQIDRVLTPGIRCTVKIDPKSYESSVKRVKSADSQQPRGVMPGNVVSPTTPRDEDGIYWGYTTRMASSISAIFDECPFDGGYDLKVGTSERGDISIDDPNFGLRKKNTNKNVNRKSSEKIDSNENEHFNHLIIVFGGVAGIEESVDADESMTLSGEDSKKMFDIWVNICPYQGSRTIRTEEALFIALARFSQYISKNCQNPVSDSKKSKQAKEIVKTEDVEFSDASVSEESSDEDD